MVHAFDAESGRLLWSAQLGERTGFARGVASNSFAAFVTNANILHALDKKTGRPIWQQNLNTIPTSTPACDENLVSVGMTSGRVVGFQPQAPRRQRERIDLERTEAGLGLDDGRPGPYATSAGGPVCRLRFVGRQGLRRRGQ